MTTLTIRLSDQNKKFIKAKAALQGKTITRLILDEVGATRNVETEVCEICTQGELNEETIAAFQEDLSNSKRYSDMKELIAEMKTWGNEK